MNDKFIILDGNSLLNRAYYAIPLLSNKQGLFTNAVYGFTNMLMRIIEVEKPCYLAVAFDKSKAHVRIAEYAEYKANRKGMPDELRCQFAPTKDILSAFDIPVFELEGYEADDLIGTLIRKAEGRGWNNIIYTGDKDALQLISSNTVVALTKKGISELEVMDESALRDKYNLTPSQIIDLKGLMGDSSDNIPGVPGVGEKTALKLLWEFGSVENVYANLDKVAGKKLLENLRDNEMLAFLSKRLATIVTDTPMELNMESCALAHPDYPKLLELFKELEFKNLIKTISDKIITKPEVLESITTEFNIPEQIVQINGAQELEQFLGNAEGIVGVSFDYSGSNPLHNGRICGVGLALKDGQSCVIAEEMLENAELWRVLGDFIVGAQPKAVYDLKKGYSFLRARNLEISAVVMDLMLAAYLLNPLSGKYSLENLALDELNLLLSSDSGNSGLQSAVILQLAQLYITQLQENGLWELFNDMELPLAKILGKMELNGVKVDRSILDEMGVSLSERLAILEQEIYSYAGEKFNINSPQQLGVILFERLGLPGSKKTKTGYSTNAEVLEALAPRHEIIGFIIEYRQLSKLRSTYVEGLKAIQDPETGKVHTSFNQTITATGRLSSTEPNLQNIPIRLELGRKIRKAFVPSEPGLILLAADYSQIELRILAHISGDENLRNAFRNGEDIHTRTASEIFGISMDEVNSDMRRKAKAVNFGIVYGIGAFSLSNDIGVSRKEAQVYIENYFARYPLVKTWIDKVIREAREKGFVTTIYNRRRSLPELFSSNKVVQAFGERTAMNTPIQGSAADIIKLAMVKMDHVLAPYKTKMLLQVHDELIFEVPEDELPEIKDLVKETMENALKMAVKMEVDLKAGPNWYDMQKLNAN